MIKRIRHLNEKIHIFWKHLFSYFIFFLIILLMFVGIYEKLYGIILQNAMKSNWSMLNQSSLSMDQEFITAETLIRQISTDPEFLQLANSSSPLINSSQILDFQQYQKTLFRYNMQANASDQYLIYLNTPDVIISNERLLIRPASSLSSYFFNDTFTQEEWDSILQIPTNSNCYILPVSNFQFLSNYNPSIQPESQSYLTLIRNINLSTQSASICFFLSEKRIQQIFSPFRSEDGSFFAMASQNETFYLSSQEIDFQSLSSCTELPDGCHEINIQGEAYIVSVVSSTFREYKYIAAIRSHNVFKELYQLQTNIILGILLCMCFCVYLSWLFTRVNLRPIYQIFAKITPQKKFTTQDLLHIGREIDTMVTDTQHYQKTLTEHLPVIRSSLCEHLLLGDIDTAIHLEEMMLSLHMQLNFGESTVMILSLVHVELQDDPTICHDIRNQLSQELLRVLGKDILLCETDNNQISVIIPVINPQTYPTTIRSHFSKLQKFVRESSRNQFELFAVSSWIFDNLLKVPSFYHNLKIQAEYCIRKDISFQIMDNMHLSNTVYYPIEAEISLIRNVCAGQTEKASQNVAMLFDNYIEILDPNALNEGLHLLKTTLQRIIREAKNQYPGYAFPSNERIHHLFEVLRSSSPIALIRKEYDTFVCEISRVVEEEEQSASSAIVNEICKYIEANHTNPNLSQSEVAAHFQMGESYLSRCFKAGMGQTYSEFLENLRICHAKRLLNSSDCSINEISAMVGYNSPQVFRRTFKKCLGINPNDYRKNK